MTRQKPRVFTVVLTGGVASGKSTVSNLFEELGVTVIDTDRISRELVEPGQPALAAIGCYQRYDDAVRRVFPDFGEGWKSKIVLPSDLLDSDRINVYRVVVEDPDGNRHEERLPLVAYLEIVAATNFKQRIRKTLEYYHADRLNYAVVGTPNRLEYDQGFFVKNGDGAADVKPIAHLYKTQVYALAQELGDDNFTMASGDVRTGGRKLLLLGMH